MSKSFLCTDRFLTDGISNFTIEITQQCNFRCSYCCYSGKYSGMRSHTNRSMKKEVIKDTIAFIERHAHKSDGITISFFGGEALLNLDNILYIVEKLSASFRERVFFDISTNGLLLTIKTVEKLLKFNIGISVSLDGSRILHDRNRKTISGEETYDRIVDNLKSFKESYPDEYHKRIRLLMTAGTLDDIKVMNESFSEIKEIMGEKPPFISHIYPNFKTKELFFDTLDAKKKFLDLAVEHKEKGIYDLYTFVLDDLIKKATKKFTCTESCSKIKLKTCLDNMYSVFVNIDGILYPCEKFDLYHTIGNVKLGVNPNYLRKWSIIYCFRRSVLCEGCQAIEYCTRCLADLKMTFAEQKKMCKEYVENIELAKVYKLKNKDNA